MCLCACVYICLSVVSDLIQWLLRDVSTLESSKIHSYQNVEKTETQIEPHHRRIQVRNTINSLECTNLQENIYEHIDSYTMYNVSIIGRNYECLNLYYVNLCIHSSKFN